MCADRESRVAGRGRAVQDSGGSAPNSPSGLKNPQLRAHGLQGPPPGSKIPPRITTAPTPHKRSPPYEKGSPPPPGPPVCWRKRCPHRPGREPASLSCGLHARAPTGPGPSRRVPAARAADTPGDARRGVVHPRADGGNKARDPPRGRAVAARSNEQWGHVKRTGPGGGRRSDHLPLTLWPPPVRGPHRRRLFCCGMRGMAERSAPRSRPWLVSSRTLT